MRIAFFVHRFWPSVGGVEKYIHELSRAMIATGHSVDIVAGDHVGNLPKTETHDGIRIHRYPAMRSPLRCRIHLLAMRRLPARADVTTVSNTQMLEYLLRCWKE